MNSPLRGRNGHLLMLILAILMMNVRFAEARVDWPEGTKGIIAKAGWFITSIAFGVVMAGAIIHAYRTVVDRRAILSDVELGNQIREQIRESRRWLAYTKWIRAENSTAYPLERAAVARIFDLERQLFGVPSPARPLSARLFSCLFLSELPIRLFGAANNGGSNTTLSNGDESINGNNRRDKGKAPERRRIPLPQISTVDGARSASISNKIEGKIAAHCAVSSAWSTITPLDFTAHNIATKYDGKKAIDRNVSLNKPAENPRSATISKIDGKMAVHCSVSSALSTITPKDFKTNNIATKYGLKKSIDRNVSMNDSTTDNIATKYGVKKATDRKVSMNKPTETVCYAAISKIDAKIAAHCERSSAWSKITPKDFTTDGIAARYGVKKGINHNVSMKDFIWPDIATKYGVKKATDRDVSMNMPTETVCSAAISKIDAKIAAHCERSSAWSTISPKDFTTDGFAAKYGVKKGINHNVSMKDFIWPDIATKYGVKKATDRNESMNKPAEIAAASTTLNYKYFTQPG